MTQNLNFSFTADNFQKAEQIIAKYPKGRERSAVLPLLYIVQNQHHNWIPQSAITYIASMLNIAPIRVHEVASFYTMFNLKPVGKHLIQLCRTTPCWLNGSDKIKAVFEHETKDDPNFTIMEVECLGACVNAPVVQINDDYFEDLSEESTREIIAILKAGNKPKIGSQNGRNSSEPLESLS